jgi:adenylate cyclase
MSDGRSSVALGLGSAVWRAASIGVTPARRALSLLGRSSGVDWESEGLLDGVDDREREQRRDLLERLAREGVPLDELRTAVAEDRLAALPVQRVLAGDDCYTLPEVASKAGIDPETLRRDLVNLGLAAPDDDTKAFDDHDLEAAGAIAAFREAGLDEQGLQSVGRVLGQSMRTVTAAIRELLADSVHPAEGERDLGLRYAELAGALGRELEIVVAHAIRVHMREGVRYEVIGGVERTTGQLPDTVPMTVAFADLSGFTALGERLPPSSVASIGDRFAALATSVARPPVRLMKLLGDGAILASSDTAAVVEAAQQLARRLAEDDLELPAVHVGVATGDVVLRRGELYGRTPNLASRLCSLAEPEYVLADAATRRATAEKGWEPSGSRRPRGFDHDMELYALRLHQPSHRA